MSDIYLKETGGVDGSSFNISIENPLLFPLARGIVCLRSCYWWFKKKETGGVDGNILNL
jgi:hypothetical protein